MSFALLFQEAVGHLGGRALLEEVHGWVGCEVYSSTPLPVLSVLLVM